LNFVWSSIAKRAQALAAVRRGFGPLLVAKSHTQVDPGTPPGRPRKLYYWSIVGEALLPDMG